MRLKLKLILFLELALLLLILALLMPIRAKIHDQVIDGLQQELKAIATTAALQLDGDLHSQVRRPPDAATPAFQQLRDQLIKIRDANGLTYDHIYTFYLDNGRVRFAVMTHPQPFIGDGYPLRRTLALVFQDGRPRATGLYDDRHGSWISACAPIWDARGRITGVLEVNREADIYLERAGEATLWILIIGANGLIAASILGLYVLSRLIIRPLKALGDGMEALGRHDFQHQVKLQTRDEFQDLARTFNDLTQQLNVASDIQASLFPQHLPQLSFCRMAGAADPCDAAGGDYYDAFVLDGNRVGIVVGDVSGHGIGPSLLMATCRASLRALSRTAISPAQLIEKLSKLMGEDMGESHFITMIYGILEADGTFTYANAGHGPAIVLHNDTVRELEPHHPPLGIFFDAAVDDDSPSQSTLKLEPGDRILLASDGLMEAVDKQDEQFGYQRIVDIVRQRDLTPTPEQVVQQLREALRDHTAGQPSLDDVTILCMDRL